MKSPIKVKQLALYKRILREIENRIEFNSNYADLHHQMGLLLFVIGNLEGAEKAFLHALKLNPKYREAALHLGCLYIEMKRWNEAEAIFLAEARKHPEEGLCHPLLKVIRHQTGRQQEVIPKTRSTLQRPLASRKTVRMGRNSNLLISEPKGFQEAHLHRLYGQFYNFVGNFLAREGRLTQAIRELKKAARLIPDAFQLHYNLGSVFYHSGDYPRAIEEFKKAIRLNPGFGMAYAHLSYLYGLRRKNREALRFMEKAVRLNPWYADLHYNLALLYGDRGRHQEAIAELKKAIRINPNYLFARINLGVLYEESKRWKEARREYEEVLRFTPTDEHVRRRLERIVGGKV